MNVVMDCEDFWEQRSAKGANSYQPWAAPKVMEQATPSAESAIQWIESRFQRSAIAHTEFLGRCPGLV
jgi:hypothetical protein